MNRSGTWVLMFQSTQESTSVMNTRYEVEVEASSSKRVGLMVPMAPAVKARHVSIYGGSVELRVLGPGTQGVSRSILTPNWSSRGSHNMHIGLSQSVALQMREPLKQQSDSQRRDLSIHSLDLSLFPRDDRGLSGLDVLVLSREEWNSASLPRKTVERWIALGGQLFLLETASGSAKTVQLGLGHLHSLPPQPIPGQVNQLYQTLGSLSTIQKRLEDDSAYRPPRWAFSEQVKPILPSFGLFMLVVITIAILMGPLNLWWGFKKKNVMRVLWTTPALSFGLSLLVGIGIIISDGFGGTGIRSLWIMILPEEQLEVTLQEQVSRTGVLLGNRFTLPQGVRIHPVRVQDREQATRLVLNEGVDGTRSGGWFANRRIQGQVLEQVRTSRARMELLTQNAESPEAVSTIGVPFRTLLVRDAQGTLWQAENTQPGQPIRLKTATSGNLRRFFREAFSREGHPGKSHGLQNGWFIAMTDPQHGDWLSTLGSVNWQDQPVIYTGPVVQTGRQP